MGSDAGLDTRNKDAKKLILVVDDDTALLECLSLMLEVGLGVEAVLAVDGEEALRLLDQQIPAVIVTDIRMPNIDGVELVRRVRERPDTRDIPIVVVSAVTTSREDAMRAGADDYVDKPFGMESILAKVRQHLAKAEAASARRS